VDWNANGEIMEIVGAEVDIEGGADSREARWGKTEGSNCFGFIGFHFL